MSLAMQALRDRSIVLVGDRPNGKLTERILREIRPAKFDFIVKSPRRVQSLCESISQGTLDAVLLCTGFMGHKDVNVIIETCKRSSVPFIPCGKGKWAEIVQSLERHKASLAPLLVRPTKLRPSNANTKPANTTEPPAIPQQQQQTEIPMADPKKAGPRAKGLSDSTKWTTEQLVWLERWVEEGITDGEALASLVLKKFNVKRSPNAVKEGYAIYFHRTIEGRETRRGYMRPLPNDFERVKAEAFAALPAPPTPLGVASGVGDPPPAPTPPTPAAAPPPANGNGNGHGTSLDVRDSETGTRIIDIKGPQGAMVIETKRTFPEICAWLMGMG
jgi:hypothetical protein